MNLIGLRTISNEICILVVYEKLKLNKHINEITKFNQHFNSIQNKTAINNFRKFKKNYQNTYMFYPFIFILMIKQNNFFQKKI